jgi:vesicle-associated membrane protein 7
MIDQVLERGERIDLLVDKSENLNEMSFVFKKNAKKLKDEMWWKNTRLILIIGGIGLFLLYLIVSSQCGGMTWPLC